MVSSFGDLESIGGTQSDSAFADLFLMAHKNFIDHFSKRLERGLYARLLYTEFALSDKSCKHVFEATKIDPVKAEKICADFGYNLYRIDSWESWLECEKSSCFSLKARFNITNSDLYSLFSPWDYGSIGYYLEKVMRMAASSFQCAMKVCTLDELIALQWGSSGVTGNISSVYKNNILFDSISLHDWESLQKTIPIEYYAFAYKKYMNESIDGIVLNKSVSERLLSKVLMDRTEIIRLLVRLRTWSRDMIYKEYGLKKAYIFYNYMRMIVEENVFDGALRNITLREIAWGFYDQSLYQIVLLL